MAKIYEIIENGKHLHKYLVTIGGGWQDNVRIIPHYAVAFGESMEEICRVSGWKIEDCSFEKEEFSPWDIGNAEIVRGQTIAPAKAHEEATTQAEETYHEVRE